MCEFLIFNTQKKYEKQKNFGNFLNKIATFWQLLDTFIGNLLLRLMGNIFMEIPERWGLTFPCENGKSEGVGGGGVLFEIPSVVGVWIFSGTTQYY